MKDPYIKELKTQVAIRFDKEAALRILQQHQNSIDIKDHFSYYPTTKKQCLLNYLKGDSVERFCRDTRFAERAYDASEMRRAFITKDSIDQFKSA